MLHNIGELIFFQERQLLSKLFFAFLKGYTVNVLNFCTPVSDKVACVNSADPDQTAPKEQSDQGLHCLPFH